MDALTAGTLYVLEDEGRVTAAAKIDQHQMPQYAQCPWQYEAPPERVLVLHTLVVDPAVKGKGYGTAFVRFYEQLGRETGRNCLRIDTNARNTPPAPCTPVWAISRRASSVAASTVSPAYSWSVWKNRLIVAYAADIRQNIPYTKENHPQRRTCHGHCTRNDAEL